MSQLKIEGENYYEILGVLPTATAHEIKNAFRKLAQTHHPDTAADLNSVDNVLVEQFKKITEAYKVLSDLEKRNSYNKENGFSFFNDLTEQEPVVSSPLVEESASVDISSAKDWSHLQNKKSIESNLGIGQKAKQGTPSLEKEEDVVSAWGEGAGEKSGFFGALKKVDIFSRRAELKKNLKAKLQKDSLLQQPSVLFKKPTAPIFEEPKEETLVNPLQGERVFNCQINSLEAALGATREVVLSVDNQGKANKIEYKIPPGTINGTIVEVNKGWERAKIKVSVIHNPNFFVKDKNFTIRVPVTIKEALDGAEIVVPVMKGVRALKLRSGLNVLDEYCLEGEGIASDSTVGDLVIAPYLVVPSQISETLLAAATVVDQHSVNEIRADFDKNLEKYIDRSLGNINLLVPVKFTEALNGLKLNITLDGENIEIAIPKPWNHAREEKVFLKKSGQQINICPLISIPNQTSEMLQSAALAIEQHHLVTPRSLLPRDFSSYRPIKNAQTKQ
jgi:DnaJ-class molecular chaperone